MICIADCDPNCRDEVGDAVMMSMRVLMESVGVIVESRAMDT